MMKIRVQIPQKSLKIKDTPLAQKSAQVNEWTDASV